MEKSITPKSSYFYLSYKPPSHFSITSFQISDFLWLIMVHVKALHQNSICLPKFTGYILLVPLSTREQNLCLQKIHDHYFLFKHLFVAFSLTKKTLRDLWFPFVSWKFSLKCHMPVCKWGLQFSWREQMLIAKKLFSFYYCYTGRRNLTIHKLLKNSNTMAKNLHHFSTQRIQSERVNFQKPTSQKPAAVVKTWLTTHLLHLFYLNSNSAKRTSKCLRESFIFSVQRFKSLKAWSRMIFLTSSRLRVRSLAKGLMAILSISRFIIIEPAAKHQERHEETKYQFLPSKNISVLKNKAQDVLFNKMCF